MTEELQLRKEKIDFLTMENRKLNIAKLTAEGALTRLENRPKYSLGSQSGSTTQQPTLLPKPDKKPEECIECSVEKVDVKEAQTGQYSPSEVFSEQRIGTKKESSTLRGDAESEKGHSQQRLQQPVAESASTSQMGSELEQAIQFISNQHQLSAIDPIATAKPLFANGISEGSQKQPVYQPNFA